MSLTVPRHLLAFAAVAVAATGTTAAVHAGTAAAASPDVVIAQVFGGGGNSGATLTNDYIELANRSAGAVDVSGWSVQYASAAGTSWQVTTLSGSVPAGGRYLVQEAAGTGGTTPLPAPDATGSIALSATSGKVALSTAATALTCGSTCHAAAGVRDFVGYGQANDSETAPAPGLSNTSAAIRAGNGTTDTDNNAADFTAGTPDPQGTGGGGGGGGGGLPGLQIHDIQGAAQLSPYAGKTVAAVPGVVTAVGAKQFWMQDTTPDPDPATSEGVVVYTSSSPTVAVGDSVTVDGTVAEFRPGSTTSSNLTTTEIEKPAVTVTGHGAALPPTTVVGPGGRVPPSAVIDQGSDGDVETSGTFDPARDGIDFWESLEGMRAQIDDAQVVGPTNSFGETTVVPPGSTVRSARGGIIAQAGDFNPERVLLSSTLASVPTANVGDSFSGGITGVVDYDFGNFYIDVTATPTLHSGGLTRETTSRTRAGQLAVATFNVENLSAKDPQTKFDALASYAVTNLAAPDVLALEEIQDNNGPTDDGVVAADQTLQKLVDAITTAGGPKYTWAEIDPINDADGGQPGGNIRVAFLYRTDRGLAFVPRGSGTATTATTVTTDARHQPHLSLSPGRIAPTDGAWADSRKPLAGEFTFRGRTVFVIANHFDSKGGDDPLFGRYQPPKEPSAVQRHQQAMLVKNFVDSIETVNRTADVVVVGDLNDYDFSQTTQILTAGGSLDLPSTLPAAERYTYDYQGNSEVLDHILLSPHLSQPRPLRRVACLVLGWIWHTGSRQSCVPYDYDVVHLNSEFADQVSDHDPQIVRLTVGAL